MKMICQAREVNNYAKNERSTTLPRISFLLESSYLTQIYDLERPRQPVPATSHGTQPHVFEQFVDDLWPTISNHDVRDISLH